MSPQRGFAIVPNHVLRDPTIPPTTRLLFGLIMSYAYSGTRRCTASISTISLELGVKKSTIYAGLQLLQDRGLIEATQQGSRRIYSPTPRGMSIEEDGAEGFQESGNEVSSQSETVSSELEQKSRREEQEPTVSTRARADEVPEDFPEELRPHARMVMTVLRSVAERWNAKAISTAGLAHVLMARPHHPLVKCAHDYAAWAADQAPRKDVVAGYRNWLDRTSPLAGTERLPGYGVNPLPDNVTRLPRNSTAAERRQEQERRMYETLAEQFEDAGDDA